MKKYFLCVLVICLSVLSFSPHYVDSDSVVTQNKRTEQTVENDILLFVTKVSDIEYKLEWVDMNIPPLSPDIFKVYRSEDPQFLGTKIKTVSGYTYTDIVNPGDTYTYYYQILHINNNL